MAGNVQTIQPGDSGCCPCGTSSNLLHNCTSTPWISTRLQTTNGGTQVYAKYDTSPTYFSYHSQDKTSCGDCPTGPVTKSEISFGITRLGGQETAYFCYADRWMPAGSGGVFNFLPHVNRFDVPDSSYRRVYSEEGTVAFNGSDTIQAELPITAKRDATYFTTYHEQSGVYFEYFAGSSFPTSEKLWGRVNRRYDRDGIELQYHYQNNAQGHPLVRKLSGTYMSANVTPYFYYADEFIGTIQYAPITKLWLYDAVTPASSRTTYYEYRNYQDLATGNSFQFLSRIINPEGCVQDFDPTVPFNDTYDVYQIKRELDAEGYATYFQYAAGALTRVTEPEGRVTYYGYSAGLTKQTYVGRDTNFTAYSLSSASGQLPLVTRKRDELGNATYFAYHPTLARVTTEMRANGNVTYFEYVGGSAGNKSALRLKKSHENGATTYYGYDGDTFDVAKEVGPRHTTAFSHTTYYRYDVERHRVAKIDALGRETLFGQDDVGRMTREKDARGYTTYFNYGATTGDLESQTGGDGDTTYYGYTSFRNLAREVSPRWTESSMASFTTYHEYDQKGRRKKTVDPLGNVTYFDWTNRNQLLAQVDARGTEREYTYSGLKLMTRETVTASLGTTLQDTKHGYDVYKNRTKTQDGLGNTTYFFYDQLDRETVRVDALQNATYSFYDTVSNRTHVRDARGSTTYHFYDALSRNTVNRSALGEATYHFYDAANNHTHVRDARGNTTYYFYDELDRNNVVRDALGHSTYFFFDEVSNLSGSRDARGNPTYHFYDASNRRALSQNALAGVSYYDYDGAGNVVKTTNERGYSAITTYDNLNRRTLVADAQGIATLFSYDALGNRTTVLRGCSSGYGIQPYGTSPYGGGGDGPVTYYHYDGLGRNTSTRDPMGNLTYFFYDLVSNRTVALNPLLHATYFGYDAVRRLTRVQDALGKTTYFEYDLAGNQTKTLDPKQNATLTRYDVVNRPDAMRYADTGSTYFFYDTFGNRTRDIDPRGNTTYYGYDALNRATRSQDALGRTVYFEYDPVSNLSKEIGAEGESSEYTYDVLNRSTNITYSIGGSTVSAGLRSNPYYVYDAVGNMTQMGDLWGLHRMGYDPGNRLTRHEYPTGSVVYYEYDNRANVTSLVYPGSAGQAAAAYDLDDRQTRIQAPSGATAYFTYDGASNQTLRILGNQAALVASYDNAERILSWTYSDKNTVPLSAFTYRRDSKGLPTEVIREGTMAIYFTYDENDRLTSEVWAEWGAPPTEVYGYRYAYDLAGNRIRSMINGVDTYYFYDQANQLKVKGSNAEYATPTYYSYDLNGAMTEMIEPTGTTRLAYNAAGLVARILWRDASATYFFYDGMLRRYAMIPAGSSQATYFLWEGMNLLQERNADGSVKDEHTNARPSIEGIGQLVETYRPAESASLQKIYPVMDWRGSITKWMKSDGTTVLASREYDSFGNVVPGSAMGSWLTSFGYQGHSWIQIVSAGGDQSLMCSPTRIYDAVLGAFLQRDPIIKYREKRGQELFVGSGPYGYVRNSPHILVDPSGLYECGDIFETTVVAEFDIERCPPNEDEADALDAVAAQLAHMYAVRLCADRFCLPPQTINKASCERPIKCKSITPRNESGYRTDGTPWSRRIAARISCKATGAYACRKHPKPTPPPPSDPGIPHDPPLEDDFGTILQLVIPLRIKLPSPYRTSPPVNTPKPPVPTPTPPPPPRPPVPTPSPRTPIPKPRELEPVLCP